jgi:hypothetical protein
MSKYNLLFPLDVTKIEVVSPFGMRVHPVTKKYVLHEGVDLAAKKYHVDGDDALFSILVDSALKQMRIILEKSPGLKNKVENGTFEICDL